MVTVQQVAQAAIGALENGAHRGTYAISGINMKYAEFYQMMVDALGQTETTELKVVPYEQMVDRYRSIDKAASDKGVEHGMHVEVSSRLQAEDLFIDPKETMDVLGYKEDDVIASIKESLALCVQD